MRVKCRTGQNETTISDISDVTFGAPQGSCLGPLLFTIFTNDFSLHLNFTKCILFADDTTIYMSHNNPTYLRWCIEEDLRTLSDWFKANLLTLNVDKSVSLTFKPRVFAGRNKFVGINIKIDNQLPPNVDTTKFLGVWLDSKLSWNKHMSKLFIKLKRSLSMLKLSQNYLSLHAKKCLYYAQIFSHLSYGILIWGNMLNQTQLAKLQSMQNKCFKLVLKQEPTPQNYHVQKMLRIKDLVMFVNMKHGH